MDTRSTIVAVASPPGHAARGIVRASGADALDCVAAALGPGPAADALRRRARGVHAARLADPAIPVLLLAMPGPASATGEDCVEVHAPGNPLLLERIVDAIVARSGGAARRAAPGEFSVRAVLSGRTDVAGAERVAAAIAAETDAQLAAADSLRDAGHARSAGGAADEVAGILALVEAGIDFTDQEDVTAIARGELERRVGGVRDAIAATLRRASGAEEARRAPHVVLVGPPNAGKSSLFNALIGHERAVAGPERGTTRDAIEHRIPLPGGGEAVLVDLPGIGGAVDGIDAIAQRRASAAISRADLLLLCDDGAGPGLGTGGAHGRPALRVRTKSDLGSERAGIATSALTGGGIDGLRAEIARSVAGIAPASAGSAALGSARAALLAEAIARLDDALAEREPELVAACLRAALDRLGEVAGAIPPDDVLGRLFAGFCIGK